MVPISSSMELYVGFPKHFRLEAGNPDFKETGLDRESFISSDPIQVIGFDKLIRKRGRLAGALLQRFMNWI